MRPAGRAAWIRRRFALTYVDYGCYIGRLRMSIGTTDRKTRKAEQSEKTRSALLRVARKIFADSGYSQTSLEQVAERAGVTTGAVYHQYRDKRALFQAVVEQIQAE